MSSLTAPPAARGRSVTVWHALVAAALAAAACAFAVFLLTREGPPAAGEPFAASAAELRALAAESDSPVYWAGERPGTRLEVTRTSDDKLYVRYLPRGVAIDDKRPRFLTVGSYPYPDAWDQANASASDPQVVSVPTLSGELVTWNREAPGSVYIARRNNDVLVEVFSPDPNEAQGLALEGSIDPIR